MPRYLSPDQIKSLKPETKLKIRIKERCGWNPGYIEDLENCCLFFQFTDSKSITFKFPYNTKHKWCSGLVTHQFFYQVNVSLYDEDLKCRK
jgi:hypothetical protein